MFVGPHRRAAVRATVVLAALGALSVAIGSGLIAACGSAPRAAAGPSPAAGERSEAAPLPLDRFSVARAQADLEALGSATREGDTAGGGAARYLEAELQELGVDVERLLLRLPDVADAAAAPDASPGQGAAVVATLPGDSPMWFVVLAPLPRSAPGEASVREGEARRDAADAALLLELTRVLSAQHLPYTTRIIWLEEPAGTDGAAASRALAARMADDATLERIRLLVALGAGCAPDLRIARDMGSHRVHRETFFREAQQLGWSQTFPPLAGFETVPGAHLAFRDQGVRPVVALHESAPAAGDPAADAGAACAPESLESVGTVLLAGLDVIGQRLAKIDRFTRAPLVVEVGGEATQAGASGSGEPATAQPEAPPGAEVSR